MFTQEELQMLNDAINMSLASNKRMATSKPQFHVIFTDIENKLNALKIKINAPIQNKK